MPMPLEAELEASRREGEREGGKKPPAFAGSPSHLAQLGGSGAAESSFVPIYVPNTGENQQSLKQRKNRAVRLLT